MPAIPTETDGDEARGPATSREEALSETILAIDHGERRIGLAIKHAGQELIVPLGIIDAVPRSAAIESIQRIVEAESVGLVVIGLPVHPDPTQARRVKRFTRKLRVGIRGTRWRFIDETLTTEAAREAETLQPGARTSAAIDDRAAALILETYLGSLNG